MAALRPILLLLACLPLVAQGVTFRICTDVRAHPPLLMPDGGGAVGKLVAAAAAEAGLAVQFRPAPIARCRAEFTGTAVHAFPMTPFDPELARIAHYPLKNGAIDKTRATMTMRLVAFRRIGERVSWDGKSFGGLDKPVLISAGAVAARHRVSDAHAAIDDGGRSLEVNFDKLLAGRGDAAVGLEGEGIALMTQPAYAGKVEMLPIAVGEQDYYLAVSKYFYRQHRQEVEATWDAIARLRAQAPKK